MGNILDTAPEEVKTESQRVKTSNLFAECGNERLFLKIELPHLGKSEDLGYRSKYHL